MDKIPDSSTHKPKKRGRSLSSSDIRLIGQQLPDASSHHLPDVNSSQQPQQENLVFPAIPRGGVTATSDHFVSFFVDNMSDHLQTRKVVQEIERIKKGNLEHGSDDNQSINLLGTSSSSNTETPAQSVPASDKTPTLASQPEQTLAHDTTISNNDSGYYSNITIHAVQNEILIQENELLKAENSRLYAKGYLIDAQHSQQAAQMALETAQVDVKRVLIAHNKGVGDRNTWIKMQEQEENYHKRALDAQKEILERKKEAGDFRSEAERDQSQAWKPLGNTWRSIENFCRSTEQIWEQVVKHRADNLQVCANALIQRAETQQTGGDTPIESTMVNNPQTSIGMERIKNGGSNRESDINHIVGTSPLTIDAILQRSERLNVEITATKYLIDAQRSLHAARMALKTAQIDVEWLLMAHSGQVGDRDTWIKMQEQEENYHKRALDAQKEILERKKEAGDFHSEAERGQSQAWKPLGNTWRSIENYRRTEQIWEQVVKHRAETQQVCANALIQRAETQQTDANAPNQNTEIQQTGGNTPNQNTEIQQTGGNTPNQNTETEQTSGVLTQMDANNDNISSDQEQKQRNSKRSDLYIKRATRYLKRILWWKNTRSSQEDVTHSEDQPSSKLVIESDPVRRWENNWNYIYRLEKRGGKWPLQSHLELMKRYAKTWLEEEGLKFFNTKRGLQWFIDNSLKFFESKVAQEWFETHWEDLLQSGNGKSWLKEKGLELFNTEYGLGWLMDNGLEFLKTKGGQECYKKKGEEWLESDQGQELLLWKWAEFCFNTKLGQQWFKKKGLKWIESILKRLESPEGQTWLKGAIDQGWLESPLGRAWLKREGKNFFKTDLGQQWLQSDQVQKWYKKQGVDIKTEAGQQLLIQYLSDESLDVMSFLSTTHSLRSYNSTASATKVTEYLQRLVGNLEDLLSFSLEEIVAFSQARKLFKDKASASLTSGAQDIAASLQAWNQSSTSLASDSTADRTRYLEAQVEAHKTLREHYIDSIWQLEADIDYARNNHLDLETIQYWNTDEYKRDCVTHLSPVTRGFDGKSPTYREDIALLDQDKKSQETIKNLQDAQKGLFIADAIRTIAHAKGQDRKVLVQATQRLTTALQRYAHKAEKLAARAKQKKVQLQQSGYQQVKILLQSYPRVAESLIKNLGTLYYDQAFNTLRDCHALIKDLKDSGVEDPKHYLEQIKNMSSEERGEQHGKNPLIKIAYLALRDRQKAEQLTHKVQRAFELAEELGENDPRKVAGWIDAVQHLVDDETWNTGLAVEVQRFAEEEILLADILFLRFHELEEMTQPLSEWKGTVIQSFVDDPRKAILQQVEEVKKFCQDYREQKLTLQDLQSQRSMLSARVNLAKNPIKSHPDIRLPDFRSLMETQTTRKPSQVISDMPELAELFNSPEGDSSRTYVSQDGDQATSLEELKRAGLDINPKALNKIPFDFVPIAHQGVQSPLYQLQFVDYHYQEPPRDKQLSADEWEAKVAEVTVESESDNMGYDSHFLIHTVETDFTRVTADERLANQDNSEQTSTFVNNDMEDDLNLFMGELGKYLQEVTVDEKLTSQEDSEQADQTSKRSLRQDIERRGIKKAQNYIIHNNLEQTSTFVNNNMEGDLNLFMGELGKYLQEVIIDEKLTNQDNSEQTAQASEHSFRQEIERRDVKNAQDDTRYKQIVQKITSHSDINKEDLLIVSMDELERANSVKNPGTGQHDTRSIHSLEVFDSFSDTNPYKFNRVEISSFDTDAKRAKKASLQTSRHERCESRLLFAAHQAKSEIATEKAVTDAYVAVLEKLPDQPMTFHYANARAEGLLARKIQDTPDTEAADFLQEIHDLNGTLRESAQNYVPQFEACLKDELKRTNTLYHWLGKHQAQFDLDEDWVQAGMAQVGIQREHIETIETKLRGNLSVFEENFSNYSIDDILGKYKYENIIKAFDDFVRANAYPRYIHDLLHEGIPVTGMPDRFKGRRVVPTPGKGLNCAIFSAIKVCQPEWSWDMIIKEAEPIKEELVRKGLAREGDLINMGDAAGVRLFNILENNGWFNPNRGLWIYQYREGKIQCIEHIPRSDEETSPQPPYAVRLNYEVHYDAIGPDEDLEI